MEAIVAHEREVAACAVARASFYIYGIPEEAGRLALAPEKIASALGY